MLTAVDSEMKNALTIQKIQLNLEDFLPIYCNYVTGRGAVKKLRVSEREFNYNMLLLSMHKVLSVKILEMVSRKNED